MTQISKKKIYEIKCPWITDNITKHITIDKIRGYDKIRSFSEEETSTANNAITNMRMHE